MTGSDSFHGGTGCICSTRKWTSRTCSAADGGRQTGGCRTGGLPRLWLQDTLQNTDTVGAEVSWAALRQDLTSSGSCKGTCWAVEETQDEKRNCAADKFFGGGGGALRLAQPRTCRRAAMAASAASCCSRSVTPPVAGEAVRTPSTAPNVLVCLAVCSDFSLLASSVVPPALSLRRISAWSSSQPHRLPHT